jgi:hypothetical protein
VLWREVKLNKIPLTMVEYSKRIAIRRENIIHAFTQLDDYKDIHVSKRGRPKKKKMLTTDI